MSDEQFTVYVSWTKDGFTNREEISAIGGVSSDEDDEPDDLFGDDHGSVEGSISIKGDLVSGVTYLFTSPPRFVVRGRVRVYIPASDNAAVVEKRPNEEEKGWGCGGERRGYRWLRQFTELESGKTSHTDSCVHLLHEIAVQA